MKDIAHSKPWITAEDSEAIAEVLQSGMLASGEKVRIFENAIAKRVANESAIATASGTAALSLALQAFDVAGREVIFPSYVCSNVLHAVVHAGGRPILCDIGPDWLMTPDRVEKHLSINTAAIVVVHTFGFVADVAAFRALGPPVIEDACQAFGGVSHGREAGSMGDAAIFSFQATKCLSTGEGGMALFKDEKVAKRARALAGSLAPMSDIQAALGLSQLDRYPEFLARRLAISQAYRKSFINAPVELPPAGMYFRFPLRCNRNIETLIARFLDERRIHVRRGVDSLLHRQLGLDSKNYPQTEDLYAKTLSLPIYPALSEDDQLRVVAAAIDILAD